MTNRRPCVAAIWTVVAASLLVGAGGCGILNPSFLDDFVANPENAFDAPNGSLAILIMNRTDRFASARISVTKENEGTVEWSVGLAPFGDPSGFDYATLIQECDVMEVSLQDVTIATDGEPIVIPSDASPLTAGLNLNCGDVISILIPGVGVQPQIVVY